GVRVGSCRSEFGSALARENPKREARNPKLTASAASGGPMTSQCNAGVIFHALQNGPGCQTSRQIATLNESTNHEMFLRQQAMGKIHVTYHGCSAGLRMSTAPSVQSVARRQSR